MAGSSTKATKLRAEAHAALDKHIADNPRLSQAVDMRAQGFSNRQIAAALGWANPSTPHRILQRFDELTKLLDAADVYHQVANAVRGVDAAMVRCWMLIDQHSLPNEQNPKRAYDPKVQLGAMKTLNELLATKAKLLGLYSPERVSVTHNVDSFAAWAQKMREGQIQTPRSLTDDGPLGPSHLLPPAPKDATH